MAKKRYYLAYGSNLNMAQMQWRCPGAVPLGTAEISGYRLLFKGSRTGSYLTIEKADGFSVPVGVWEVTEADEARLDRYEGYPHFTTRRSWISPTRDWSVRNSARSGPSCTSCMRTGFSGSHPISMWRPAGKATQTSVLTKTSWRTLMTFQRRRH